MHITFQILYIEWSNNERKYTMIFCDYFTAADCPAYHLVSGQSVDSDPDLLPEANRELDGPGFGGYWYHIIHHLRQVEGKT